MNSKQRKKANYKRNKKHRITTVASGTTCEGSSGVSGTENNANEDGYEGDG